MERHRHRKRLFPRRREAWFVGRHRNRGHKVIHVGYVRDRCHWSCDCGKRFWC